MHGSYNRLLRVNLSTQTWAAKDIPDEVLSRYLGGKGLVAHLLLENTPAGVEPLATDNPLIFATGPATGTILATASRYGVFSERSDRTLCLFVRRCKPGSDGFETSYAAKYLYNLFRKSAAE